MNENLSTSPNPEHGADAPASGAVSPGAGPGLMPSSLRDRASRLAKPGAGGDAPAAAPERRGLGELSLRVLGRWGALPLKAVALITGFAVSVSEEDAQLLGECSVDVVRHAAVSPDPATEAYVRWGVAHGAAIVEGFLASAEKRAEENRKKQEGANA